jgi:hypothetical protein
MQKIARNFNETFETIGGKAPIGVKGGGRHLVDIYFFKSPRTSTGTNRQSFERMYRAVAAKE